MRKPKEEEEEQKEEKAWEASGDDKATVGWVNYYLLLLAIR